MSNQYGPECYHRTWAQGDQYQTFYAYTEQEYDEQSEARQVQAANQGLQWDGDPHECLNIDPAGGLYVVMCKAL